MQLTELLKTVFIETAQTLTGSVRRMFMARVVKTFGRGGTRYAETELGWSRVTLRKGQHEIDSGFACLDALAFRGRKRTEDHLPNWHHDIDARRASPSQTDPRFKTMRLYTRLSAAEVRRQLILPKGYPDAELPTVRTRSTKLNQWNDYLRQVAKRKPKKKVPATDAIFEPVHPINTAADQAEDVLRISMDAKTAVNIGDFARDGVSRVEVAAADHDFKPPTTLTPFGILLPPTADLFLYFSTSKITRDFIVDCLDDLWRTLLQPRFPQVTTLVLNLANGPENHSRRTQFLKRLITLAVERRLTVRLAYYPPYHRKYNPVERCFGGLEQHWNGALLDDVNTVLRFAESMTWKGKHPVVKWVTAIYATGIRLTQTAMKKLETQIKRLPHLEKWFVDISPPMLELDT